MASFGLRIDLGAPDPIMILKFDSQILVLDISGDFFWKR
jgi:hypothetical protein